MAAVLTLVVALLACLVMAHRNFAMLSAGSTSGMGRGPAGTGSAPRMGGAPAGIYGVPAYQPGTPSQLQQQLQQQHQQQMMQFMQNTQPPTQ